VDDVGCEGNVLLNRMCGAHMYMVPRVSPYLTELKPRMEKLAKSIRYGKIMAWYYEID
jgi:hypothetical protein